MTSYPEAPRRTGVPRDVLRWLQSLDLSSPPKNFRRDLSNGYVIAEIFYWYFSEDIQLPSYSNGTSLATKLGNWSQLEKFFSKRNLNISKELIEGTLHSKPGAAELLLQDVYVMLTNRRIKTIQDNEVDFTDWHYQERLPMMARSTATKAVKSNITLSEVLAEPDLIVNQQKVQALLDLHLQQRYQERIEDPKRFNVKPTLGEQAIRLSPPLSSEQSEEEDTLSKQSTSSSSNIRSKSNVQFREIKVRQADQSYVLSGVKSSTSCSTRSSS
ncbi:spermatogenesis-associated protein 4 [Spea bombifrons]|uniref:spermatogenesis-associated protein 4 n=1 Tax=Spea bombifrons TaxID=233779 RepID=UPI002349633C|nr:spermatogenesis-associated protein 4 [Spea bombifrons]